MGKPRRHLLRGFILAFLALGLGSGAWWYRTHSAETTPPAATTSLATKELPPLDDAERQRLWNIEHHGNLLNKHGFSALARALERNDAAALTAILAADFTGQGLREPLETRVDADFAHVVRQQDAGKPPAALDRARFVEQLLSYRRLFPKAPKVKVALMGLGPTRRDDMASPWEGTCQVRLWGQVGPGESGEVLLWLRYRLPEPNADLFRRGGWLERAAFTQTQVARAPHFLMRDVAAQRGLEPESFHDNWVEGASAPNTGGVYVCDYNRDGYLDLLVTDLRRIALFQGQPGGKFKDVTAAVGLPTQITGSTTAAFADLDGDGWEDLILGGRIYRNEEGRHFTDYTLRTNLRLPPESTGIAIADYDRDGRLDVYVTRTVVRDNASFLDDEGIDRGPGKQILWRNLGDWRFENVSARSNAGAGNGSAFTAVWLDANNDGWPDLYVAFEFGPGILLLNRGDGTFERRRLTDGPGDFQSMGLAAGDVDNDGNIDLYVANMYSKAGNRIIGNLRPDTYPPEVMDRMRRFSTGSQLWRNRGGLAFEPLGQKWQVHAAGWSYGPAMVDLDNDGFLDLYATCGFLSRARDGLDG